jgi:hypothetical protein
MSQPSTEAKWMIERDGVEQAHRTALAHFYATASTECSSNLEYAHAVGVLGFIEGYKARCEEAAECTIDAFAVGPADLDSVTVTADPGIHLPLITEMS